MVKHSRSNLDKGNLNFSLNSQPLPDVFYQYFGIDKDRMEPTYMSPVGMLGISYGEFVSSVVCYPSSPCFFGQLFG